MNMSPDSPVALALEEGAHQVDIRGCRVLVVDDNPQNTELVQAYLDGLPIEIATAVDGLDAMAQAERFRPDLVLLDVMMPRMSGFEVCQKIKQSPDLRDTVVIMVTALHEVGDFERAEVEPLQPLARRGGVDAADLLHHLALGHAIGRLGGHRRHLG